jgi:hypothetical protein
VVRGSENTELEMTGMENGLSGFKVIHSYLNKLTRQKEISISGLRMNI